MNGQRLPLQLGGREPSRAPRRLWRAHLLRGRPRGLTALVGVAAAFGGAYFGSQPAAYVVELRPDAYVVGGARLAAAGDGVYDGGGGVVVLQHRDGALWAGGSAVMDGRRVGGSCLLRDSEASERCEFQVAGRRITSVDQRSWLGWARQYEDGRRVDIWVRQGDRVPVPLALGW